MGMSLLSPPGFQRVPINHIGYRVANLEQAIEGWARTYGAGPFYVLSEMPFDELEFMGEPFEWSHVAAYGICGPIGVELQTFEFPVPMAELDKRLGDPDRLNHICYLTDDTTAESARLEALGYPMFLYGKMGDDRFYWHDAPHLGHSIELHSTVPAVTGFIACVEQVARGWDGSDPVRHELPQGFNDATGTLVRGSS
jgi:methylmalonyl-CoA/ethylmalonyl-CoA epimerase